MDNLTKGKKRKDIRGNKYGKLTVIDYAGTYNKKYALWLCKCDCGNEKVCYGYKLVRGSTKSCGCGSNNHRKYDFIVRKTKLYFVWIGMKERCKNPKHIGYKNYGGRGIKVCKNWSEDYVSFYNWAMSNGYEEGLTIDRIDNNKGYSPENCKWATRKEQTMNRRNTIKITFNGETKTLVEWAEIFGIPYRILNDKYKKHKTGEELFNVLELNYRDILRKAE